MHAPAVTIRRAGPDDANGVLTCLAAAFEPYRAAYTAGALEDTILSAATIQYRLAEMTVFVAVADDGRVVGTIGYGRAGTDDAHIRGMAVRREYTGSGIAQRLLETVEGELRRDGCSRVTLDTTAPLARAIRFYERNGFRRSGVVRDFYGMELFEYVKMLAPR